MDALAKSTPDGYTLGLASMGQLVFNSYLFSSLPYDPLRDIEPVAMLVTGAMVVASHPSLAVNSLPELVAMAKQRPGALFVATTATGSPPHVIAMRLMRSAGIEVTMVPFSSGPEGLQGVLRGEPPLFVDAPTSIAQHVRAGRLKALVVTGRTREPALPDVPTVGEAGYPDAQGEAWIGLVAPARTPAPIVQRLNREIAAILGAPGSSDLIARLSFQPLVMTPAAFRERIREDHAAWGSVLRDAGIKLD